MIKLLDKTFFKMAFLFLIIVLASFALLIVAGYFGFKDKQVQDFDNNNLAKTASATTSGLTQ